MIRNLTLSLIVLALVGGAAAYSYRFDLLLVLIKYRTAMAHDIGPPRDIAWNQGPENLADSDREQRPNIVMIVADDLGFNDISTFGGGVAGGRVKTPHIDTLAAAGAVFSQSYSGAATCAPSRAMIMTGRYPTRTGFEFTPVPPGMGKIVKSITDALDNGLPPGIYDAEIAASKPPYESQGLPAEELTVAEILQDRGYHTAHIGKWHLGTADGMAPHHQGFDESLLMVSGLYLPEDDPGVVNAKLDFDPIDRFLWSSATFSNSFNSGDKDQFEPGGYLTDYWTDEAVEVIRANRNRPFFLYLAHWGIHTPLQATLEDYEAVGDIQPHRLRVYAAMIRALDRSVGRINAALAAQGLSDNTLVVFTSDNGGAGYIGLPEVNAPYRGWKISQFEGGLRVPLFMKWPGRIRAGTVLETPVAHIDLMPTLAAASGAPPPQDLEIDGRNLLPLTLGDGRAAWDRETLFWQSGHYRVVRHGDWKLQIAARPQKQWLYNLADDPTEQVNLAGSNPEKLAELLALLDAHESGARRQLYPPAAEIPIAIDKTLAERFETGDEFIYWPN